MRKFIQRIRYLPTYSLVITIFAMFTMLALTSCGSPSASTETEAPIFSEPKISAPTPQEPGKEIGISIDVTSASGVALNYDWSADGGEIVRGQDSPAITYRTPAEPGVYFVRVNIRWGNNSVEKMTSIQVEALAAAAATATPTSRAARPTRTATAPPPTSTLEPTATPQPLPDTSSPTPSPTNTPSPTDTPAPVPPTTAATQVNENQARRWWAASGHADAAAEAFVHWDEDDPAEVPTDCAKCHSMPGFLDFLGEDGSRAGQVDSAAPIGTVLECDTCHNPAAEALNSVVMPSGLRLINLGSEAVCMQCHQGRQSTSNVNAYIQDHAAGDDDTVSSEMGFLNIHYHAAAATRYGSQAQGGYEYPGRRYVGKFEHDTAFQACTQCHNSHSLELNVDACVECHPEVTGGNTLKNIRTSSIDYDGDGHTEEGIYYEMTALQGLLYQAIIDYSRQVADQPLAYTPDSYPYFFVDADRNGQAENSEYDNRYNAWTPRLLRAAYNYQVSQKDPGAFTHNAAYIIQLLYDSLTDLNGTLDTPADLSQLQRPD